ncbi:hypothetical protein AB0G81_23945, partial [Streptomyces asoensis]
TPWATTWTPHSCISLVALTVGDVPKEPAPHGVDEEEWVMQLSPDGSGGFQPVGRRQVVGAGAASLMTWRTGGQVPMSPTGGVGAGMLDASRSLFTHYRRLGQSAEPGILLPGLIAQTHTLRELSAHVDAHTRRELLALGSRYAEYVGWLVQETGNEQAALWWTQRAVDLAAAGGDRALAGYALVRRALVTLYQDEPSRPSRSHAGHRATRFPRGSAGWRRSAKHKDTLLPATATLACVLWTVPEPCWPVRRSTMTLR